MLPHLQVSSKISKFLCLPHLVNYSSSIHHQFVIIFAIQQQNFALTISILASFIYLFFYSALLALSLYSHPQVLPPQPAGTIAGHNHFSSHRHCSYFLFLFGQAIACCLCFLLRYFLAGWYK